MIEDKINKFIDDLTYDAIHNPTPVVKEILSDYQKNIDNNIENVLTIARKIMKTLVTMYLMEPLPKDIDEIFSSLLKSEVDSIKAKKISMTFEIRSIDHPDKLYRKIEVPATLSLDQFAYAILGSFNDNGSEVYRYFINEQIIYDTFDCDAEDDDLIASSHNLFEINFDKISNIIFLYDLSKKYSFDIKLVDTKEYSDLFEQEDIDILDAEGYGLSTLGKKKQRAFNKKETMKNIFSCLEGLEIMKKSFSDVLDDISMELDNLDFDDEDFDFDDDDDFDLDDLPDNILPF